MDGLILVGVLIVLAIFVGVILSIVNTGQIKTLKNELKQVNSINEIQKKQILTLKEMFDRLKTDFDLRLAGKKHIDETVAENIQNTKTQELKSKQTTEAPTHQQFNQASLVTPKPTADSLDNISTDPGKDEESEEVHNPKIKQSTSFSFETFLMGNGLIWIGATVLALGGVFLAKYSIEAGLFPPHIRVVFGAIFGVGLVIFAEYLYQNPKRFKINSPLIPAALASGGVITCFSITLVAFDFYQYLNPSLAFVLLATISIVASVLSIRYGPVLAVIGVLGSFAVPALVNTGSNNISALLLYVGFVSIAALLVYQRVKVAWVWWLCLIGHLAWYGISLLILLDKPLVSPLENSIVIGFVMVTAYIFVLVPVCGWTLSSPRFDALTVKELLLPRKEQLGIFLPFLGLLFFMILDGYQPQLVILNLGLMTFLLLIPVRHSAFDTWPYLALIVGVITFLLMPLNYDYSDNLFPFAGAYLYSQSLSIGFIVYCCGMLKIFPNRPSYLLLLVCAPLSTMALSYALSAPEASHYLYPLYSAELGVIALISVFWALKSNNSLHQMTFLLLANGALSLVMTMLLSAGTLTLALAIQISLMAWLSSRYKINLPDWIYKIALAFVLARLTFAPWTSAYKDETIFGLHWTIVIYPIVCGLMWLARKHTNEQALKAWFSGALIHTIALLVTTETSYLLTGNYPNLNDLSYAESILLGLNWLVLSIVYYWRKQFSSHPKLYKIFAAVLLAGFIVMHIDVSLFHNPFVSYQDSGTHFLVNWLIVQWLVPALLLLFMIKMNLTFKQLKKPLVLISGAFLILYVNGLIRGAFNAMLIFGNSDMSQPELYTYSIVWLLIAISTIVFAQRLKHEYTNKIGFIILAIVVLKAFIIDMSNLEGLYRAISFIGLGLSILGIAWLFQRFKQQTIEIND